MTMMKRNVMTLYSNDDIYSHQVRIVLAEKGVSVDILRVIDGQVNEDLLELNPYNNLPTLVDRDLVLYDTQVILEYLEERFPHPPLLPVYPVARAKDRLMIRRIYNDWYSLMESILADGPNAKQARKDLLEVLLMLNPVFAEMPYFLNDDFTLVDCAIAPLLWRFPLLDVKLPARAKAIAKYCELVFQREAFQASLTEVERDMREIFV